MACEGNEQKRGRVLVALSGGVDSSVAVHLLLQAGFDCVGATMRLYDAGLSGGEPARMCGNLADIEAARGVAERFGIPFHVIDCRAPFEYEVVEEFTRAYERGLTPNPCTICNRRIKFGLLLEHARALGCDALATGHYARIDEASGIRRLRCARDTSKDQSYFLYSLTQEQLARVIFPLGDLTKEGDVRRTARELGLTSASRRDSQGICFVPDNDFATFIERRRGHALPDGEIVDTDGAVLGTHHGAIRYTVGQRKGLGVAAARPLYVTEIDACTNTVTLGETEDLMAPALLADAWIWSVPFGGSFPLTASARIRYHQGNQGARISPASPADCDRASFTLDGPAFRIDFDEPQRAIAPGQAVVLYDGDIVLGGGRIVRALP